ncbi:hypothetical protein Poli38472_011022 [Pythium oligandrum]|uniref:Uncharacterized protein n=1 Tax=Pythium oligandrum TaxID=41045 RepID=A0A8K1CPJ0_PYTOL|nr:hypothetical protein Poli38472_011022 [Pythium oligandrum]|eukprot:TMW67402.1 hypothetical protein Poli38472_011022 [Pythium oligandrum]
MPASVTMPATPRRVEQLLLSASDISMVDRACLSLWHFQQLTKPFFPVRPSLTDRLDGEEKDAGREEATEINRPTMELDEGMTVAAIAYEEDRSKESGVESDEHDARTDYPMQLTLKSQVGIVYTKYRCVLCLDASPSALSIDPSTGKLFLDLLCESVQLFVTALLRPSQVGKGVFRPEISVSVIVQGASVNRMSVLVQGFVLEPTNVGRLLVMVRERIQLIEDDWAMEASQGNYPVRGQASLSSMMQNAVFALNSLPSDAAPILVLATDGVVDMVHGYAYDSLVMQLARHDVQCHFISIGHGNDMSSSFGFVPDTSLLQFLADSTGGSIVDYVSLHQACTQEPVHEQLLRMTKLQRQMFVRESSVHAISSPIFKVNEQWCSTFDGVSYTPLQPYRMWREKIHEYRIHAEIDRIVEARIREGFVINKVHVRNLFRSNDGSLQKIPLGSTSSLTTLEEGPPPAAATKMLLVFLLQWKQNVWLEYVVSSTIEHMVGKDSQSFRAGARSSGAFLKKDDRSSEWYVKVNVLAHPDFLRSLEDVQQLRLQDMSKGLPPSAGKESFPGGPAALHAFIRNVQDVDRVLLHLITAAASAASAAEASSQLSFGSSSNHHHPANTPRNQNSHPVFGIIGELSPVLWHRWFHVDRFEVLCVVRDESCADMLYRPPTSPLPNRSSSMYRSSIKARNQHRETVPLQLSMGVDKVFEQLRSTVLKWSSQRLGKELYLRFLGSADPKRDVRAKQSAATTPGVVNRRRQRSSLNSMMIQAQLASGEAKRDESERGALCFVRLEVKNRTLVAVHIAFFSCSASTRKETLADLRATIAMGMNEIPGMASNPPVPSLMSRSVVLCHRLLSRLMVSHDTLQQLDANNSEHDHEHGWNDAPEQHEEPIVACCGGSELQLQSVFGSYMWHTSWRWQVRTAGALVQSMRHLHEARIRSGFWVLDWQIEEDATGESYRVASVVFGREIIMEDEMGRQKTSLIQYAIKRLSDTSMETSLWMEPQHGFVKSKLSDRVERTDMFHWGLKHAIGHDIPVDDISTGVAGPAKSDGDAGVLTYFSEGHLLQLIRGYVFRDDRHLLSYLHTFETLMNSRDRLDTAAKEIDGVIGVETLDDSPSDDVLVPSFSTARLLDTSKRSVDHFLMYLEESMTLKSSQVPSLSTSNEHLYSMLERTLRGLSDCEVAWTDHRGVLVGNDVGPGYGENTHAVKCKLPLWLKHSIGCHESMDEGSSQRSLSHGRCFAKLLNEETVVLAFLPAIDCIQLKQKQLSFGAPAIQRQASLSPRSSNSDRFRWGSVATDVRQPQVESSSFKITASADDIVLYQERRQSFREGYKSWRMGHFQGSKDEKSLHHSQLSPHTRSVSTSQDFEFCEAVSRKTAPGSDFHLLIERSDGSIGSGFFQVAFYECSISRLATALAKHNGSAHGQRGTAAEAEVLKELFARSSGGAGDTVAMNAAAVDSATLAARRKPPLGGRAPSPLSMASPTAAVSTHDSSTLMAGRRFRKQVKRAHEHNFSRGVYVALRDGSALQQTDLMQALSSCVEVPVDFDITMLYRMLQLDMLQSLRRSNVGLRARTADLLNSKHREALKQRVDHAFEQILKQMFGIIEGTKYFYFTGNESVVLDENSGGDIENFSQLFMEEDEVSNPLPVIEEAEPTGKPPLLVKSSTDPPSNSASLLDNKHAEASGAGDHESSSLHLSLRVATDDATLDAASDTMESTADSQITQEEDAEFNKDVAVATSSFSSPFFVRFDCRELPASRISQVVESPPPVTQGLTRSASSQSALDLRNVFTLSGATRSPAGTLEHGPTAFEDLSAMADWIATSSAPKVALRVVTLTLPNEQLLERSRRHQLALDVDGKSRAVTPAELFASLPLFQRLMIKRLRHSMKEWTSIEILRILQSIERITPATASLIQKLFDDLPVESLTTAKYPLQFVAHRQENYDPVDLLKRELVECSIFGQDYQLHECNGLYFVVKRTYPTQPDIKGIQSVEIPYWAYFTVEDGFLHLHFHHPDHLFAAKRDDGAVIDRLAVLTQLHLGVNAVCKKVNQFLLLLQLHETRTCSDLLLRSDPANPTAHPLSPTLRREASGSADWSDRVDNGAFYWPGQFECDRKYAAFFRLHERLVPNIALNTLCTSALEPFQVHNRRHIFVYRDKGGHVFYIKMSVSVAPEVRTSSERPPLSSSAGAVSMSKSVTCPTTIVGNAAYASPATGSGILLEVFGVCDAGDEVTQELCRLLERKLDESIQLILMKLLARNVKFQLSPTDTSFICPPGVVAAHSIAYKVPQTVYATKSLIPFLCQTLSTASYIRQMSSSTSSVGSVSRKDVRAEKIPKALKTTEAMMDPTQWHPALFGRQVDGTWEKAQETVTPVFFGENIEAHDSDNQEEEVVLEQVSFLVNLNPELRLSPNFLSRVGKGLALLRVEVIRSRGYTATEEESVREIPVFSAGGSAFSCEHFVLVRYQVWIRGSIVLTELSYVLEAYLKETLLDCCIEKALRRPEEASPSSAPDGSAFATKELVDLLEQASRTSSSSVAKLSLPVTLPRWDLGHLVTQMTQLFRSIPAHLRPVVMVAHGVQDKRNRDERFVLFEKAAEIDADHYRIVPTLDAPPAAARGLVHSDSVQSDLSEADSVSGRLSLVSVPSFSGSMDSNSLAVLGLPAPLSSSSSSPAQRELSLTDAMLHPVTKITGNEDHDAIAHRSLYYVIDVSVQGLVFYGYNMSSQLLDTIVTHFARMLTWTLLRDKVLRSLLFQRGGMLHPAPSGSFVVHPQRLITGGGRYSAGLAQTSVKDWSVNFVDFHQAALSILEQFNVLPKSLESVVFSSIEMTSLAKILRDANVAVIDSADGRPRSRSNASQQSFGGSDLSSAKDNVEMQSRFNMANNRMENTRAGRLSDRSLSSSEKPRATVPSPTKRNSASNPSLGPGLGGGGGGGISVGSRLRPTASAANALLAARARARGGLPGKLGGPGVGSSRSNSGGDSVAPWDLPVTNTRVPSGRASGVNPGPQRGINVTADGDKSGPQPQAEHLKRPSSGGQREALQSSSSTLSVSSTSSSSSRNIINRTRAPQSRRWKQLLRQTWGPRSKLLEKEAVGVESNRIRQQACDPLAVANEDKTVNPLRHYGEACQRVHQQIQTRSALFHDSLVIVRKTQKLRDPVVEVDRAEIVRLMMNSGHLMLSQRFRVTFVERWEVVKLDEEYMNDRSNTGRLRALQASMDLVNLLSYKKEFVFSGNDRTVANLLTEHTVQAMCGKEGGAVREMKMQTLKDVFHLRMDVVHQFFEHYAVHLKTLGFRHLRLPTSRYGQRVAPGTANTSGMPPSQPHQSAVDAVAAEGEGFCEYFFLAGNSPRDKRKSVEMQMQDVLVLELKCDHNGVQIDVVLVNEHDLRQQENAYQRHLDVTSKKREITGEQVLSVAKTLRIALNTRVMIHDFTIGFLHDSLIEWTARKKGPRDSVSVTADATELPHRPPTSLLHNMVKGIRCFLRAYPQTADGTGSLRSASDTSSLGSSAGGRSPREYSVETSTVELPVRNLQSDCSESILVKILLRYVACHGARYEVVDLTQFGTPDTIVCHSVSGNFFNRNVSSTQRATIGTQKPGYSLLITTQDLWKGKKRPKNSVLLALLRSPPKSTSTSSSSPGSMGIGSHLLLPPERALAEAELFVKELFRAAAANYERDLLWTRLLYTDNHGLGAEVAHTVGLPVEYFHVDVGPQQLEECLRLSICTPVESIDPSLTELLSTDDVCWQEFALRVRDVFADQVREYQFEGQAACHFLLLCPDARDLMIHLTFPGGISSSTLDRESNRVRIEICRREEPPNQKFTFAQRRVITDFVNCVVHWLWRCLLYD